MENESGIESRLCGLYSLDLQMFESGMPVSRLRSSVDVPLAQGKDKVMDLVLYVLQNYKNGTRDENALVNEINRQIADGYTKYYITVKQTRFEYAYDEFGTEHVMQIQGNIGEELETMEVLAEGKRRNVKPEDIESYFEKVDLHRYKMSVVLGLSKPF